MVGISIWEKQSFFSPADVIIVGAGLMGLWSALELKQHRPSLQITILERAPVPLGASTRNAGFACFGSPTELLHNIETSGIDHTLEIVEMRWKGMQKIQRHFSCNSIDWEPCGGYECINKDYRHWHILNDKLSGLNKHLSAITGHQAVFTPAHERLSAFGLTGFDTIIQNPGEAALHSGKLVRALTEKVQAAGVNILYGFEVKEWHKSGENIHVLSLQHMPDRPGRPVTMLTSQLLFCTNAFTKELLSAVPVTPGRGQVIVTSPIANLAMNGTFHFDEGFYYWRNLGNRVLLGGARNSAFEEEATTCLDGSDKIRCVLEDFLRKHLASTHNYAIEHHWSGIMAFTNDHLPYTGRVSPQVFAAIACNGMGVALTPVMAEKVAVLLLNYF